MHALLLPVFGRPGARRSQKKRRAKARRFDWRVGALSYQITQRFLFTIGLPAGTSKVCWNCGRLASVPFTR